MRININVQVHGGKRTPPTVNVYGTAVNTKTMEFANGSQITDVQMAEWIQEQLEIVLKKVAGRQKRESSAAIALNMEKK